MPNIILVIDQNPAQRESLSQSLQSKLGCRTLTCSSVTHAADFFAPEPSSLRPDMTLLDWNLTDGEKSRLVQLNAHAPLIALVAQGDYEAGVAALNAGAQDFLTRPVAIERIRTTFRNMLLLRDACSERERLRRQLLQGGATTPSEPPIPPFAFLGQDGNMRRMDDIEADAIRFAMQYYHGRMTEVAKRLGIGRSTLYRKLSGLGIKQEQAA